MDYLLWAVQRFYEFEATDRRESECRYVEMIREVTCEINDLDYLYQGKRGILWGPERPLSLAGRIQTSAKKEPRI